MAIQNGRDFAGAADATGGTFAELGAQLSGDLYLGHGPSLSPSHNGGVSNNSQRWSGCRFGRCGPPRRSRRPLGRPRRGNWGSVLPPPATTAIAFGVNAGDL